MVLPASSLQRDLCPTPSWWRFRHENKSIQWWCLKHNPHHPPKKQSNFGRYSSKSIATGFLENPSQNPIAGGKQSNFFQDFPHKIVTGSLWVNQHVWRVFQKTHRNPNNDFQGGKWLGFRGSHKYPRIGLVDCDGFSGKPITLYSCQPNMFGDPWCFLMDSQVCLATFWWPMLFSYDQPNVLGGQLFIMFPWGEPNNIINYKLLNQKRFPLSCSLSNPSVTLSK